MTNWERWAPDMLKILQHIINLIDTANKDNKQVLVCCDTGRDCAPFVAAAYIIWTMHNKGEKTSVNSILTKLEQEWPDSAINCAFNRMLSWFSASLTRLGWDATPDGTVSAICTYEPYVKFLRQQEKMTYVMEGLYLSSLVASESPMTLHNNMIRAVIRIRTPGHSEMPARYRSPDYQNRPYNVLGQYRIREHVIDMYDSSDPKEANILSYVRHVNYLINMYHHKKQNVLVHCDEGVSRSVAFIIAYMIDLEYKNRLAEMIKARDYNLSSELPSQLLTHIRTLRPMANPNPGFMAQLRYYIESYKYVCPENREGRFAERRLEHVARFLTDEISKYVPCSEPDNDTSDDEAEIVEQEEEEQKNHL
jgi:protein-tyrosine phosphatase